MIINDLFNNKKQDVAEGRFQDEYPEYGGKDKNKAMTYDRNAGMGYEGEPWSDSNPNWSGDNPTYADSTYEPDTVTLRGSDGTEKEYSPDSPEYQGVLDREYGIQNKLNQIKKAFTQAEKNNPNAKSQQSSTSSPKFDQFKFDVKTGAVIPNTSSNSTAPVAVKPKSGSWQELAKLNNITDPTKLRANTFIKTPDGEEVYVNKGDTLSGLAQRMRNAGTGNRRIKEGNPVPGQNFTTSQGQQMNWNPATKGWASSGPVQGDGFDVVSSTADKRTTQKGDNYNSTYTSTAVAKNPTTGQQQSLAKWDHTDSATGKNYSGTSSIDPQGNATVQKNYDESKKIKVDEISLPRDYRNKAAVSRAMAQTNQFFGRDDPAVVAAADRTIANRTKGLARADARRRPYTAPPVDQDKQRRDLADKYPNIDELVRQAELRRDPQYDRADGPAYYDGRDAEQNYHKLKQIQRMIRGAELDEMDFGGVGQVTDSDTGDVTTNFNQGPLSVSQTKTPGGYTKQTDQQVNLGTATLGARTVGPNIGAGQLAGTTTKTATNTATGQAKQQVKGVGFGGATGATVGKNYVGSSDDELAKYAADSATGINEEPGQVTAGVPGASFTANKNTNTLSATTNVHGVDLTATRNMTPGGAKTFSASTNVAPNLNMTATQKSADYSKGQLAGTKAVSANYTDTTGALGKPGQQHTATRTAGVGFGGASGSKVGKNYVDQYSVNESMDRIQHLAGIKPAK